jgi:tRNA1Val (adenine37-N6)-methyltransferase
MSEQIFRFKQFSVAHDLSAQKTGTDGVLLGAWTHIPSHANSILDIGTGSGLIALMLAQRTAASIDAIDLDENSYRQATLNFSNSKWSERLQSYHNRLQEFYPEKQYDLMVCNPPFFEKSLKPPLQGRSIARHGDMLDFDDLIIHSKRLLKEHGLLSVIIPYGRKENFAETAESNQFILKKITKVKGNI